MDYNFLANQISESPARIENETYRTLWNAFSATYFRNRAPLSFGVHFETWQSWAYDHAVTGFLVPACRLPEVRCTTITRSSTGSTAVAATARRYRGPLPARARRGRALMRDLTSIRKPAMWAFVLVLFGTACSAKRSKRHGRRDRPGPTAHRRLPQLRQVQFPLAPRCTRRSPPCRARGTSPTIGELSGDLQPRLSAAREPRLNRS